jgi:hypothetical protein
VQVLKEVRPRAKTQDSARRAQTRQGGNAPSLRTPCRGNFARQHESPGKQRMGRTKLAFLRL